MPAAVCSIYHCMDLLQFWLWAVHSHVYKGSYNYDRPFRIEKIFKGTTRINRVD